MTGESTPNRKNMTVTAPTIYTVTERAGKMVMSDVYLGVNL